MERRSQHADVEGPAVARPIRVHFVLMPDSLLLDWAGPAEALRTANAALQRHGQAPRFSLHFCGPQETVRSSVGAMLSQVEPLPTHEALKAGDALDWVVIVGQIGDQIDVSSAASRALLHWLTGLPLHAGSCELLCVCAGAVLAAHAGLLTHRRATTHHHHLHELQTVDRQCAVQFNRVFVMDPPVYTSAGVTTGIDLFLHRISEVCGPAITAEVAQTMVVGLRRGPQDPELSPFLEGRQHLHPSVHRVQDAVSLQPADDWTVDRMADVAHTSSRHLARLFQEHTGMAPLTWLRSIRLATAAAALQAGHSVSRAASLAGFASDTQLRRAWHHFGRQGTPGSPL